LVVILLVAINGYFINCCYIISYFINGYRWLNYHRLLVVILLVAILLMVVDGYFIGGYFFFFLLYYNYWWLLYYKLLLDILNYIIISYW
jgi:hypothetical protein